MHKEFKTLKGQKFHIHTFGCQMNENDSEHIAGILCANGAVKTDSPEDSDIIIVNTCAVREKSIDKAYSLLGRLRKLKEEKGVFIGVLGCMAQLYRDEILDKKPFIDLVLGPHNYWKLSDILSSLRGDLFIATAWYRDWHEIPEILRGGTISGYITISEGCNNFCAYCVVPYTRGREKSRPMQNILEEAEGMNREGYREIQLLGQNVNSYLDPDSGSEFPLLLREVSRVHGVEWIRFITSHPKDFTQELAVAMSESQGVCHQLHLPIQAGSNPVLERMNRGYTREKYLDKIRILRELMPDISLSTDIIVGFPEETEEDFEKTLSVLRSVRYTNIFSFRYSPRPQTAASRHEDDVPSEVKQERLIRVQSLQREIQLSQNRILIGRKQRILCMGKSKKDSSVYAGRNEAYQVVNFRSETDVIGEFVKVEITDCGPYSLRGEIVSSQD